MRFRFVSFLILMSLPCLALAATTQPVLSEKEQKAQVQAEIIADMQDKPFLGEKDLSEIINFSIVDGRLFPSTPMPVMEASYAKLKGVGGFVKFRVIGSETLHTGAGGHFLQQFAYRDLSVSGNVEIHTAVDFNNNQLSVSQFTGYADDGMLSVQYIETAAPGPEAVVIYVQNIEGDGPHPQRRLAAPSLLDLYLNHSADVNTYLRPVFRTLRQEQAVFRPDDHLAYQVFQQDYPIDPALPAQVESFVRRLDADSFTDRQAAMKELQQLGGPAAISLLRNPIKNLSPEQKVRVDSLLAPFHPLPDKQAAKLRNDADFLLDCQFGSDAELRRTAAAQLQRIGGRPPAPDEKAAGADLADALAKLRPQH